jgi:Putative adhesin
MGFSRLIVATLALPVTACLSLDLTDAAERTTTRNFTVRPHAHVQVNIRGGSISTTTGDPGTVRVELVERVWARNEAQMDALLADYEIGVTQAGDTVSIVAKRRAGAGVTGWLHDHVGFSARIVVPADATLELGTSGGSIVARGDRQSALHAKTGGGSINVDGGSGTLDLDTSGGSIVVERALTTLKAETSGGSITVRHVGREAQEVDLKTSGGSIRVGIDPAASLRVDAGTSGGRVHVDGLPWSSTRQNSSTAIGVINGGSGHLRAHTSGGSVTLDGASP